MEWNCEYCGCFNIEEQCTKCGGGTRILPMEKPMSEREVKFRLALMQANWDAVGKLWKARSK